MPEDLTRFFDIPRYQLEHAPSDRAFNTKRNGKWEHLSTQEYCDQIDIVSNALIELGIQEDDKVAIVTEINCVEWHILDMAILQIGAVDVPLYATLSSKDYKYILDHSDSKLCFVSNQNLYDKVSSIESNPNMSKVYCFDNAVCKNNWAMLFELGKDLKHQKELEERRNRRKPSDLATIVYTSGTTGTPKGVMLTHEAFVYASTKCKELVGLKGSNLRIVSYLPISHVFERLVTYYYQFMSFEIYFAESIEKLADNWKEVKPAFTPIVPRLVEKIYDKIIEKGHELTGLKKALFFWAVRLAENSELGEYKGWKFKIADKLIFSKWREIFGGELQLMISGSAPLQPRLIKVFTAAGLTIYEGYGMTETSAVISLNTHLPNSRKINTVGKPIPQMEVKIAEDGEILVKGPNLFTGYYKNEAKTNETLVNGYLHTGDVGEISEDGFLKITDRKKQMFKTSGGKYIAPAIIENIMKQSSFIEQIMVIGEGQKMPAALIQVNYEYVNDWAKLHNHKIEDVSTDQKLIARIQEDLDRLNKNLGKWEKIKKFEITPEAWTIDDGLLTPTLKIKRKAIKEKYKNLFTKIYG